MTLWILIADAAGARILEVLKRNDSPRLIYTIAHPASRAKGMNIVTDRPGSVRGAFGAAVMGPTTEPKEIETEEFARQVASYLQKEFNLRRFDALSILAPAHFLGLLRADLPPELQRVVVFEQTKELAYVPDTQLAGHLTQAIDTSFHESFARAAVR